MLTTGNGTAKPDPEVPAIARRRRFTAEYKRRILREYEASPKGERGAVLRREGLYHSHVTKWLEQRAAGELEGLTPKKRGRKAKPKEDPETMRLRKRVKRLEADLAQAQKVIEVQKKISEILGIPLKSPDDEEND